MAGDNRAAEQLLSHHLGLAEARGEIRQSISLRLVMAEAALALDNIEHAAYILDRAVHSGLFTGLRQIYVDHARRLLPVIDFILRNKSHFPADRYRDNFLRKIKLEHQRADKKPLEQSNSFTPAELDVLRELDHGFSNKEIALRLGVSPNTVKYHMKNLFSKLGASARMEAVKLSREQALLEP